MTDYGKFLKRWEYQTTLPASFKTCMHVRKQQLEWDMEKWTGSKLGKEYFKAVYCHHAYLTFMQSAVLCLVACYVWLFVTIFAWNFPLVSLNFLKRLRLFSILCLSLFLCIVQHCSLCIKAFFSLLASLWNSAFRWVYLAFPPLPFTSLLFSYL